MKVLRPTSTASLRGEEAMRIAKAGLEAVGNGSFSKETNTLTLSSW